MPTSSREVQLRARKIRLLLLDVDGVLTDGRIYYVPDRDTGRTAAGSFLETKTFHSRDGLGIRFARDAGLKLGLLSGRASPVVQFRARELGIEFIREGAREKVGPYREILAEARLSDDETCYIGDDLVDLPVLRRCGFAVGVGNGHPLLRRYVHYWTRAPGGAGAVREVIEVILKAQGKFDSILEGYLGPGKPNRGA
ncbi:MAG TPA: HAD family hydrolase [Terriglobia bacterium]|nr:HAD family hydrolase [Terriglobia bacterium]